MVELLKFTWLIFCGYVRKKQKIQKGHQVNCQSKIRTKTHSLIIHEVEDAIRLLSNGKSPGLDNIPAELIKSTGIFGKKAIHRLCVKIWETFEWPHEWKQQEFVVLHKSGDKKDCSNYRTIALISHISKILLYIILKRLKQKLEFEISEEQAGFRQGRGTADMLCALQVLIEKVTECTSVDQATEGYIQRKDSTRKAWTTGCRDLGHIL